jgi:hypothetical protein
LLHFASYTAGILTPTAAMIKSIAFAGGVPLTFSISPVLTFLTYLSMPPVIDSQNFCSDPGNLNQEKA